MTGLVDGFADVSRVRRLRTVELDVPPGPDADLLVSVLDEVIFRLEVEGEIVLDAAFVPSGGGLTARLTVGDVVEATAVGAVPKAVSLHGLRFAPDPASGAWSCAVTVDV
ncbi:archease [Actinomadura sp. CNU-125]|uniref:archease n=1 Tax=Actinomadura sp. CNU-125 TaxID=1904961 RepID=UPI003967521E